jgi:hypothetical protein
MIRLVLDLILILQRMTQYCVSNKVDNGREQKVEKKNGGTLTLKLELGC